MAVSIIVNVMEKSRLYTGGGDDGTTSLVGGERARKDSVRLEAYGTVDEFSAELGVVAAGHYIPEEIQKQLQKIQNRLFDIGGYLASRPGGTGLPPVADLDLSVKEIEKWIDSLDAGTPKIREFVLPGGCMAAARAHVARTVCRRAERQIYRLAETIPVEEPVLVFMNRLSDYLFVLARKECIRNNGKEIIWDYTCI